MGESCNAFGRGRGPREDDDDDERERNCRQCNDQPAMPVCGSDGRTYPSACFAVNCVGLAPGSVTPGPCSRRVCVTTYYPLCSCIKPNLHGFNTQNWINDTVKTHRIANVSLLTNCDCLKACPALVWPAANL